MPTWVIAIVAVFVIAGIFYLLDRFASGSRTAIMRNGPIVEQIEEARRRAEAEASENDPPN
jgi:hypothetical protein